MADYRLSARPPRSWRPLVEELEPRLLLTLPLPDHVQDAVDSTMDVASLLGPGAFPKPPANVG